MDVGEVCFRFWVSSPVHSDASLVNTFSAVWKSLSFIFGNVFGKRHLSENLISSWIQPPVANKYIVAKGLNKSCVKSDLQFCSEAVQKASRIDRRLCVSIQYVSLIVFNKKRNQ